LAKQYFGKLRERAARAVIKTAIGKWLCYITGILFLSA